MGAGQEREADVPAVGEEERKAREQGDAVARLAGAEAAGKLAAFFVFLMKAVGLKSGYRSIYLPIPSDVTIVILVLLLWMCSQTEICPTM